ncbi:disks large-associated protein 5 [Neosynchiropus ocellatus]
MESRFAHLRERDTSVSMLRVKMSRRRSQSQKENRDQAVNQRRQLEQISEQDISCLDVNETMSSHQEKTNLDTKSSKNKAVVERAKQLERWRERKALEKEKEKREKERKGVFKTGVYHPKETRIIISVPALSTKTKETRLNVAPTPSGRVTRSMKQQQVQKPLKLQSANQAVNKAKVPSSFAPEGFVFEAPTGLSSFKFEPISPRSADAFLIPSQFTHFSALVEDCALQRGENVTTPTDLQGCWDMLCNQVEDVNKNHELAPPLALESQGGSTGVSHQVPSTTESTPECPLESKHDVPYFRSEISKETERLTSLSAHWELKVEDESIPEEMRDRMRTAVGQARLLMKERFNQFSGLVDDCELQRGEKITTCTDLQGFWDMVYYQVEDVTKKFEALKEVEARGWVDEHKPPPRQRKVVKKPAAVPPKAAGTKAAARSRLAAVKAAMKARQLAAEAEKVTGSSGNPEAESTMSCEEARPAESPAKASGSVRRSSRLSAVAPPQDSPCSNFLTPRRVTRRSLALMQTQESPAQAFLSPTQPGLVLSKTPSRAARSQCGTPQRKAAPPENDEKQPETALSQENVALLPEVDTGAPRHPSISTVQEENKATNTPLSSSRSLCLTPDNSVVEGRSAESPLLLFTPNLKDRIRESVCPSDLMVFTPPL